MKRKPTAESTNQGSASQRKNDNFVYLRADCSFVDTAKVTARMQLLGINKATLVRESGVERTALYRMLRDGPIESYWLERIAEALKTSPETLKPNAAYVEPDEAIHEIHPPRNWTLESIVSPHLMSANGVGYCIARLRSELVTDRISRGKFYDLVRVPPAKRDDLHERLIRHPTVCTRLQADLRIAKHIDVRPMAKDTAWWVLDEWIGGSNLEDVLAQERCLTTAVIQRIGLEILLGLQTLHNAKIIFRELAPARIYVDEDFASCTLTDFELAKLLDSEISVSGVWKLESRYRAPEVGNGDPRVESDLYSWGVIMLELLADGKTVAKEQIHARIGSQAIIDLLNQCCDELVDGRPDSAAEVAGVWSRWKVES